MARAADIQKGARNKEIYRKLQSGEATRPQLAREHGIKQERIRQIYVKEKRRAEWEGGSFASLNLQCFNILRKLLYREMGIPMPTLADLKSFVDTIPEWEKRISLARNCGPQRLGEIKQFFRENGLIQ
jgi:hypothetical protein